MTVWWQLVVSCTLVLVASTLLLHMLWHRKRGDW